MYCQKCGAENKEGSQFCCNCAESLTTNNEKQINGKKLYSAHLLNVISSVMLIMSILFIAYTVSHAAGSFSHEVSRDGAILSSTKGTLTYDTSGAPIAYIVCVLDAIVVILGLIIYFNKSVSTKRKLAYIYMLCSFLITILFFFASIRTLSFTCGLGFILTIAGILQIVAGCKFLSALKND